MLRAELANNYTNLQSFRDGATPGPVPFDSALWLSLAPSLAGLLGDDFAKVAFAYFHIPQTEAIRVRTAGDSGGPSANERIELAVARRAIRDAMRVLSAKLGEPPPGDESDPAPYLMGTRAAMLSQSLDEEEALRWVDRYLPIAERLDLIDAIAGGLILRGSVLVRLNRSREALVLLRGGHQLAISGQFQDFERGGRTLLTFYEQWNDPAKGLDLAREGLEIAERISSRGYGYAMVGNGSICAMRVGEWDWATRLLDEWIPSDAARAQDAEFLIDRAILTALRGEDPARDIAAGSKLRQEITDVQFESYEHWARAWAAFTSGSYPDARREAEVASQITHFFHPLASPLAARAALWSHDAVGASTTLDALLAAGYKGAAVELDVATIRAGIAALEGRSGEALAGYRDALRGWRQYGIAFEEALAVADMASLLPDAERALPDVQVALAWASATLERLGAKPILRHLRDVVGTALPATALAEAAPR